MTEVLWCFPKSAIYVLWKISNSLHVLIQCECWNDVFPLLSELSCGECCPLGAYLTAVLQANWKYIKHYNEVIMEFWRQSMVIMLKIMRQVQWRRNLFQRRNNNISLWLLLWSKISRARTVKFIWYCVTFTSPQSQSWGKREYRQEWGVTEQRKRNKREHGIPLLSKHRQEAVSAQFQIHSDTLTGYQKIDNIQPDSVSLS